MIQNSQMLKHVANLIEHLTAHKLDYLASYPSVVKSQREDGSLDIQPDDTRFPQLNARIRYGVPGVTAKVSAGGRVLLQFEGGNPKLPVACIWESSAVTEISIAGATVKLGNSAGEPVAIASKQEAFNSAVVTWLGTHVHVVSGTAAKMSETPTPTAPSTKSASVLVPS
jgi:hypothetical protein